MPKAMTLPRGLRAPDLGGRCVSPAVALGPQPFMADEAGGRHPAEPWAEGGPPGLTGSWDPAPPASPVLVLPQHGGWGGVAEGD